MGLCLRQLSHTDTLYLQTNLIHTQLLVEVKNIIPFSSLFFNKKEKPLTAATTKDVLYFSFIIVFYSDA